ncbi:hypothetical protein [Lacihabitans soyangensis]|uniref:Pectate lyase superfamily protein domain-containing protein n=1 Tax=Lacihabitans soyangensis TaxID=869394 RepID=A0AAE3H6D9_9BACT|nr:hypothetical protein [Lacihabitans soyangensis]MCP9765603.1 hypothetical protein [Lacihabitans soyangensis]
MKFFYFLFFVCNLFTSHETLISIKVKESSESIIKTKTVKYSDFGAKGDGKADDIEAIIAAHAYANEHNLKVKVDDGATYYIGSKDRTAIIQTDTDFGDASFIIDDSNVANRTSSVFLVSSKMKAQKVEGILSLKRNQSKIDLNLRHRSLITVTNSNVKHYIRFGLNQNNGSDQTDIFLVGKNGQVDQSAPIIWDFDKITSITALPIDEKKLTITGGRFKTIANREPSKYNYYSRNLAIKRSNVTVSGLYHEIVDEREQGAPYGGFIHISECCFVKVENCILTGHKTYETIGNAGKPVSMGSYDLLVNRALNVSFVNCTQTNDIEDRKYWGILGSNFCKNLLYDGCKLSRFDAHQGVANATIRNSTLGHMGINAIGSGTFLVENSVIRGGSIVNLRSDYGSTWDGDLIIRDCLFVPRESVQQKVQLIAGYNSGLHDFGYPCTMPANILIENLKIDDSKLSETYSGPAIFMDFNPEMKDERYSEKFPYQITKEVILKNVKVTSGKTLRLSDNAYMFRNVKLKEN